MRVPSVSYPSKNNCHGVFEVPNASRCAAVYISVLYDGVLSSKSESTVSITVPLDPGDSRPLLRVTTRGRILARLKVMARALTPVLLGARALFFLSARREACPALAILLEASRIPNAIILSRFRAMFAALSSSYAHVIDAPAGFFPKRGIAGLLRR